jgi:F0F1-type ATP synthase assembly protein I
MNDKTPPQHPGGDDSPATGDSGLESVPAQYAAGSNQAWTALGYLMAGMIVWGLLGWLVDQWLHLRGIATAVGIVVGVAGGVVLIVRKLAVPPGREEDGEIRR